MPQERVNVSLSPELFARMEAARGDVSRSRFVQRVLEEALYAPVEKESRSPEKRQGGATTPRSSAPSRPVPVANVLGSKVRRVPSSRQAALNKAKGL